MAQPSNYKSPAGEREIMRLYDTVLSRWPVPYEGVMIPTRHGDTFGIRCGDPVCPPLILLHGSTSNALAWFGDVASYSRHFYVHAVDLVGEPGKSSPNRPAWQGNAFAEWMQDVVDGLQLRTVSIQGLSQGGWTAIKYTIHQPNRVGKLVLLSPAGIVPTRASFVARAIFYSLAGRWGAERLNRYIFGEAEVDPTALEFMNAIMLHFKPRIGGECMFTDEELDQLKMPVLLMGGARDVVRPMDQIAARLEQHAPRLLTVLIPELGHALVNTSERVIPFLLA